MKDKLTKICDFLQSKWLIPPLFLFGAIFQILGLYAINVCIMACVLSAILIFCKDVKNIFGIFLYAAFYLGEIFSTANWYAYGTAIGIAVCSFIYFVIKTQIKRKKEGIKVRNSRIFIPLVFCTIAYSLGGVISNFQILPFLITLGISFAILFFVYVASNYTTGLKEYLPFLFVCGAIMISIEMLASNALFGGTFLSMFKRDDANLSVGAENINVAALFILLGQVACFQLGEKSKKSHLYLLLSAVFVLMILITACRMIIALSCLSFICLSFYTLSKIKHKKSFTITFVILAGLAIGFVVLDLFVIKSIIYTLLNKLNLSDFSNGRSELWPWCIARFKEAPLFGYGFITPENIRVEGLIGGASTFILAHNTLLQWLTSLGIVGTIVMLFYTFIKYRIMLDSIKTEGIFPFIIVLIISLSGITDQAAQMDTFIYVLTIITVVSVDNHTPLKTLLAFSKKTKKDKQDAN